MYARQVGGRTLSFELWPGLERGVLVMRDRETGTLWSQLTGKAIDGPLLGHELTLIPTRVVSIQQWRALHPDTTVYEDNSGLFSFVGSSYVLGQDVSTHASYVLGTRVGSSGRGYLLTFLDRQPVFDDRLAGIPILVAYDPGEGSGIVWDRRVGDRTLRFFAGPTLQEARDDAGGTWDLLRGVAVAGPLSGMRLTPLWVTLAYTQNWMDYWGEGSITR